MNSDVYKEANKKLQIRLVYILKYLSGFLKLVHTEMFVLIKTI